MIEEWRAVVGFEGAYEVSDQGRVRSLDRVVEVAGRWGPETREYRGREIAPQPTGTARYLSVTLSRSSKLTRRLLHDLVLRAFVGPPGPRQEARHLNCDNYDNRLSNLAWGSREDNRADSRAHGTLAVGERIAQHKLTTEDVLAIRAATGNHKQLADAFGVSRKQISRVKRRESWSHV